MSARLTSGHSVRGPLVSADHYRYTKDLDLRQPKKNIHEELGGLGACARASRTRCRVLGIVGMRTMVICWSVSDQTGVFFSDGCLFGFHARLIYRAKTPTKVCLHFGSTGRSTSTDAGTHVKGLSDLCSLLPCCLVFCPLFRFVVSYAQQAALEKQEQISKPPQQCNQQQRTKQESEHSQQQVNILLQAPIIECIVPLFAC